MEEEFIFETYQNLCMNLWIFLLYFFINNFRINVFKIPFGLRSFSIYMQSVTEFLTFITSDIMISRCFYVLLNSINC